MDGAVAPPEAEPAARQALLHAALRGFAAHGFEGASTRAIAGEAGANQGLIRHHFGSKEGLWRELIERGLGELDRALRDRPLTAVLAERAGGNPHLLLVHVIVHALLEPGARREWLLRDRRLPPTDVLLGACLGAWPPRAGTGPWARRRFDGGGRFVISARTSAALPRPTRPEGRR